MENCPWCNYNPSCSKDVSCDFRSLPYEKMAILDRMSEEMKWINEKIDSMEWKENDMLMSNIVDVIKGTDIMRMRLLIDFGMSPEELKEIMGVKGHLQDRVRLLAKMKQLRNRERKPR